MDIKTLLVSSLIDLDPFGDQYVYTYYNIYIKEIPGILQYVVVDLVWGCFESVNFGQIFVLV